ncbi:similar to hypothetical protein MGC37914 (predicted), isoform CRA_a [Rattus norvegicus]
MLHCW